MSDTIPGAAITFVESAVFTKRVVRLGLEEALRRLQHELGANPTAGSVDPGTGGLRKVRLADPAHGRGKRGAARVHYLWIPGRRLVYLLFVYSKDETQTLSPDQKKTLAAVVHAIKRELAGQAR